MDGLRARLILALLLITYWYLIWGIFLVPYRLRGQQRKSQHLQRVQLFATQAMMAGQMKRLEGQ